MKHTIGIHPERLKKLPENLRFKLWWALVHLLSQEEIVEMNRKLGHVFFKPESYTPIK